MSIGRQTAQPAAPDAPILQWAGGATMARPAGEPSARFAPFVGFHSEVGKHPDLDTALQAAKLPQVEIKHPRPNGAEIVLHWSFGEAIRFLPVTPGPPATTIAACLRNGNAKATAEAGIGLRWTPGERSKLALAGFVEAIWQAGYLGAVQLSVKSRMSDYLLTALLDHVRVAEAADALVDRERHPDLVSPAELWWPLRAGPETPFGKNETRDMIPLMSGHPATVGREYIRALWRSERLWAAAVTAWPLMQRWAQEYAKESRDELAPPAPPTEAESDGEPGLFEELPPVRGSANRVAAELGVSGRRGRR